MRTPSRWATRETALEEIAFDLMVAADVLSMLGARATDEDVTEVAGALSRLEARARLSATVIADRSPGVEGSLARALAQVLAALEASARSLRGRASPVVRELMVLVRRATLELARSVQSREDLWAASVVAAHGVELGRLVAESARTRSSAAAAFCPAAEALDSVLGACVRAQALTATLARARASIAG